MECIFRVYLHSRHAAPARLPTMQVMKKVTWIAAAVLLALACGGAWWWTQRDKAQDVTYRTAKIERGNLQATVSASGAVNPVTQVSVGTQVSGQIKELYVDFNSEVKAGQLIALIDPETFEYRVRSAQADVDSARAAVLTAQANIAASNAAVSRAKVDLIEAQRDFERQQSLVEKQFVAQNVADKARALVASSTESVKAAEAQLGVTQAQIKSAQANVAQRESALAQARIDLSRTKITSPVNGIVIKRAIEKGQTVAASLQAPELFVIAQNLSDMQVDASIDESDVGRIRTGQKATFTVDAYPGQTFEGSVKQVRKAAQNVANVVTYVAVVGFTNTGDRLLPGMTANVRLVTDLRENVLKIPNAALRVKVAGVEPAGQGASSPARGASGAANGNGVSSAPSATLLAGFSWLSAAIAQPVGGGGGGGFAAQRERLVSELALSAEQQTQLDAIQAELRPQFMAMRDMADGERAAAREKVTAEMRQKISAMLTPAQRTKYQEITANAASARAAGGNTATAQTAGPAGSPVGATPAPVAAGAEAKATLNATNSAAANDRRAGTTAQNSAKNAPVAAAGVAAAAVAPAAVPALTTPSTPSAATAATPAAAGTAPATGPGGGLGGGPGGGPLAEFRNRLITDVQLSAEQIAKADAVIAAIRPQYATLRDLAPEDRTKARERITADMRAKIGDLLTPEQKAKYAVLQAESASRTATRGKIYLMGADGKPVAYNVRLGITDGTSTELMVSPNSPNAEVFKEGALVIIGTASSGAAGAPAAGQRPTGPRMAF
jgi:HlyD family secretion protein